VSRPAKTSFSIFPHPWLGLFALAFLAHRIFTFQPLVYAGNGERFLVTNLGAIASALKKLGHEAQQIAFAPTDEMFGREIDGVLLCSPPQAGDPEWWAALQPWAVITQIWCATSYDAIRNALMPATPRLIDRLDTDGTRSPYICWRTYLYRDWDAYRDSNKPYLHHFALWQSLGRSIVGQLFPGLLDKRLAGSLETISAVIAESSIAAEQLKKFQRVFDFPETISSFCRIR
jgi:hypothetical protein